LTGADDAGVAALAVAVDATACCVVLTGWATRVEAAGDEPLLLRVVRFCDGVLR
jgi:hypothetical protein